ncbi:MAG: tripartite tricarboxylate transporter substrate binding protein [Armatimonadota bacterium]|nr:tripartite tricarboxylate transporter substrate binding protein [Armatimonadota bacterium]MDR7432682.1 tripartite tricarboxylate transporter substrate binding protein [Armatimonadota bacterium]MDR7515483.1 tripartite tricarboxylate transporter substrate binding protein [Armatimonadota bacterium]MDR7531462.1 tripartite tricarboxylate transporter substrate binding protein [Armatimonadota bacterium]MDR7566342.1 tripartite tricarboxylate transporter substrate binding protein [Armatimonadota bact
MRKVQAEGWLRVLVVAVAIGWVTTGVAVAYPTKPLTIIVPWSPGGGTDRTARALAVVLEKEFRYPVGVVNRTGGGGVVGHMATATAEADGHTLGMITIEITMMSWLGLTHLTFADYRPIALLINNRAGITVRADAPWKTYRELVAYVRANPGRLKASGTAAGGIWDLARVGWLLAAGLTPDHVKWVPSAGAAAALQELVAGGVDICTCSPAEALPLVQAGRARVLAVMADRRWPPLPNVPTLKELGVDFEIGGWAGLAAPKGIPDSVAAALDAAVGRAVRSPEFAEFIRTSGFWFDYKNSQEFSRFLAKEHVKNGKLLREGGFVTR